jgi:hypothetical protein
VGRLVTLKRKLALEVEVLRFPSTPRYATYNGNGLSDFVLALDFDALEFENIRRQFGRPLHSEIGRLMNSIEFEPRDFGGAARI